METVNQINIMKLHMLVEQYGSQANLGEKIGRTGTQISQWLSGYRNISTSTKREIETSLSLPVGWLDKPIHQHNNQANKNYGDGMQANFIGGINHVGETENNYKNQEYLIGASLPLLNIKQALNYVAGQKEATLNGEQITTFTYHSDQAFAIRMPDRTMESRDGGEKKSICEGDILIIEPNISPISGELILVAFEQNGIWHGMVAQFRVDIDGTFKLSRLNEPDRIVSIPENAKICGVVLEIKRNLVQSKDVKARLIVNGEINDE